MKDMSKGNCHMENPKVLHNEERVLTEGIVPPTELCLCFLQVLIYAGLCLEVLLSIIDFAHFLKPLPPVL